MLGLGLGLTCCLRPEGLHLEWKNQGHVPKTPIPMGVLGKTGVGVLGPWVLFFFSLQADSRKVN